MCITWAVLKLAWQGMAKGQMILRQACMGGRAGQGTDDSQACMGGRAGQGTDDSQEMILKLAWEGLAKGQMILKLAWEVSLRDR